MDKTIASCYLFQQSPGSEVFGGLQLTLSDSTALKSTIDVINKDFHSGSTIEDDISWMNEAAKQGIYDYAQKHQIDLSCYHIVLSNWAYHPIDSHSSVYYQAAQSAFRSALAARNFTRFSISDNTSL